MEAITIDPEFRDLIPPLAESELNQLHNSLCGDGCRDPLVIWKGKGILLDGHNRHAYCTANGIEFRTVEVPCADRDVAKRWIILNQLGRRNLSPDVASLLRGEFYESLKKEVPNPDGVGGKSGKIDEGKSCPQQSTAEVVAKQTGVSPRTIKNDAKFASAAKKTGKRQEIMAGTNKESRKEVIEQAEKLENPDKPKAERKKPDGWRNVVAAFRKLDPSDMKKAIEEIDKIWNAQ